MSLRSAALSVDLGKTLLKGDPFYERLFTAIKSRPLAALHLAASRAQGTDQFQRALLDETRETFRISTCPRESAVERLIDSARRQGKPIEPISRGLLLSSAGDPDALELLEGTALDEPDDVEARLNGLRARYPDGFAHLGAGAADLPFWRAASERYGVNLSPAVRRQAERENLGVVELKTRRSPLPGLLRAMRPHQWLKNLLVFVPVGLDLGHFDAGGALRALLAFTCLCLLTSGTYLVNDILDIEDDRRHPRKRNRPIAAGDVPILVAVGASAALIVTALFLGVLLRLVFAGALLAYLAITLAYSFRLKRVAMVDVLVIAVLFTLRILAGMLMTSVVPSHWLLMFSIFFFLSLAFMKREVEFNVMHQAGKHALSGRGYAIEDRMYVLSCGLSSGMASIVIFALFITDTAGGQKASYGAPVLLWAIMFCLSYWILRMWLLTTRGLMNDDPILFAARDRTSLLLGGVSTMLIVLAQVLRF